MDANPFTHNPWLAIYVCAMLIAGCVATSIYLYQWKLKLAPAPWSGVAVPTINLPLGWTLFCLGLLLVDFFLAPYLLPVTGIFLAVLATISLGYPPMAFWQIRARDVSKYIGFGFYALFLVVIPLHLTAFASTSVLLEMGFPILPQPAVEKLLVTRESGKILFFAANALIIAPIWEEITFRGFLYPMLKAKTGRWAALGIVSVLFAAMHGHLPTFLPLVLFGIILTFVYEIKGSLGYSMALHALFNATSSLTVFLLRN